MTTKQILNSSTAPDGSQYVTLTDGAGNLVTAGGSSGITIGTTTVTGGATTQVLFNLAGVVSSDSGLTYAGSSGAFTAGGLLRTSSAGTAANPSLSIGNTTTGIFSVSTTGLGHSINGVNKLDYGITVGNTWTFLANVSGSSFTGTSINSTGPLFAFSTVAMPAGGTTGSCIQLSSTSHFGIHFGSGAPTLSAAQGSLYLRSDGTSTTRAYINTDGSTTWTALVSVA